MVNDWTYLPFGGLKFLMVLTSSASVVEKSLAVIKKIQVRGGEEICSSGFSYQFNIGEMIPGKKVYLHLVKGINI